MSHGLIEMPSPSATVPPLRDGDRLTRDEFERRWDVTPEVMRAELNEEVVRMSPPPVGHDDHSLPHLNRGSNREAYRRNGVREHLVRRAHDRRFDCFLLTKGRYKRHRPDADGVYRSRVMPRLWLDPDGLLAGDRVGVQRTAALGIDAPEHATFVAKSAAAAGRP